MTTTKLRREAWLTSPASLVREDFLPGGPFPGLEVHSWGGATMRWRIALSTGRVEGWPTTFPPASFYLKVRDGGTYVLRTADGTEVARIEGGYVPHSFIPGEFGDYMIMSIEDGVVSNWPAIDPAAVAEDFAG